MNLLNPTTPPRLHIEALPKEAIACGFTPTPNGIIINCWLPDRWASVEGDGDSDTPYQDFVEHTCDHCRYYYEYRTENFSPDEENLPYFVQNEDDDRCEVIDYTIAYHSPCPCCKDGIGDVDWPCLDGHDDPGQDSSYDFDIGPTRLSVEREIFTTNEIFRRLPGSYGGFSAVLESFVKRDTGLFTSSELRVANAYGGTNHICWGRDNDEPSSLLEAAEQYASTEANNDLLPINEFANNCRTIRGFCHGRAVDSDRHRWIADSCGQTRGLIVASAAATPQAFLLLAAAGFPIEAGFATAMATWHADIPLPDGRSTSGWLSEPAPSGECWLLAEDSTDWEGAEALLLGSIPNPFTTQSPCASTVPSSSELAVPAAI